MSANKWACYQALQSSASRHHVAPLASTRSFVCICRVPLQYLTNTVHWRELILAVGLGALIPRPETELLIDFAQQVRFRPGLKSAGCCCSAYEHVI